MFQTMSIHQTISDAFAELDWQREPHNLYAPIEYALASGGKRLRPTMVMMAAELFGGRADEMVQAAQAMEVFHNFTLLHDDVMDRASIRRGRPTVCAKWNDNTAILSGDAMLVRAYQLLEAVPADKLHGALHLFSETALEVCEGQQMDADFEHRDDVTIEEYFRMISLKTGALLAGSLRMGALLAGASEAEQQLIYDFGMNLGLAFQVWDDYLDCYGNEATFGKRIGGDIREGKRTYLYVSAAGNAELARIVGHVAEDEDVERAIAIYTRLGIDRRCADEVDRLMGLSLDALNRIARPEEAKRPLRELAVNMINRKF